MTLANLHIFGGVGTPTLDVSSTASPGSNRTVSAGGSVGHVLRTATRLGLQTQLLGIFGKDDLGRTVANMVRRDFPNAQGIAALAETPITFSVNGHSHTAWTHADIDTLPPKYRKLVRSWPMSVVGPMSKDAFPLVRQTLAVSRRPLLLLSWAQLRSRSQALLLMKMARTTVINQAGLRLLAGGERDPITALKWLRSRRVTDILVTVGSAIVGFADAEWVWHPGFHASRTANGAWTDEVLMGTVMTARAFGETWLEAVRLGNVARAISSEGGPAPSDLDSLRDFAQARKTCGFAPRTKRRPSLPAWPLSALPSATRRNNPATTL